MNYVSGRVSDLVRLNRESGAKRRENIEKLGKLVAYRMIRIQFKYRPNPLFTVDNRNYSSLIKVAKERRVQFFSGGGCAEITQLSLCSE